MHVAEPALERITLEDRRGAGGEIGGLDDLPRLLAPNGVAILELGQGQAAQVAQIAAAAGFSAADLRQDLGGIARALTLRTGLS